MKLGQIKNKKIIFFCIFLMLFTLLGGTLAYFRWTISDSQKTNIVLSVDENYNCSADGGEPISGEDISLVPTSCTDTSRALMREINVSSNIYKAGTIANMALWLNVNQIDDVLADTKHFKYALTTSDSSCDSGVITSGSFNGSSKGSKINLVNNKIFTSSDSDTYYLWIWLDKDETNNDTMNKNFNISLGGKCSDSENLQPAEPVLDKGMIPVKISNDGTVTTVLENDLSWHNYDNKEWANVVLVNDSSRSKYLDTTGVKVNQSDILAYYVWIPRYRYKIREVTCGSVASEITEETHPECYGPPYYMTEEDKETLINQFYDYMKNNYGIAFTLIGISKDNIRTLFENFLTNGYLQFDNKMNTLWKLVNRDYLPSTVAEMIKYTSTLIDTNKTFKIDIEFESGSDSWSRGNSRDTYYTHPAFWWDDDNDTIIDSNEMLPGIWVGKFETSGSETVPTILPGVKSLNNQNIKNQFDIVRKISSNGNSYGVSVNSTNAHMMKNSEWAAILFLTNTKYGVGGEIRINNYHNEGNQTGCGASRKNGSQFNVCGIPYGSNVSTYPQSTTGNITGVFDMSGGLMEYLMGTYNSNVASSGFGTLPQKKYFDNYPASSFSSLNFENYVGHAIMDVAYEDTCSGISCEAIHKDTISMPVSAAYPWYTRGGSYAHHHYLISVDGISNAYTLEYSDGAYNLAGGSGINASDRGFRSTVVVGYGE